MKQLICKNGCNINIGTDGNIQCMHGSELCPKRADKGEFDGDCLR